MALMVIDGLQFARKSGELVGRIDGAQLTRLAEIPCQTKEVLFRVVGGANAAGKPSLTVKLNGDMKLVCQRCLAPLLFPLSVETELELSRNLDEIEGADDDIDRVLAAREMNVEDLVEDEVILALPMIPRHAECLSLVVDKKLDAQVEKQVSPFGVLNSLRKRTGRR